MLGPSISTARKCGVAVCNRRTFFRVKAGGDWNCWPARDGMARGPLERECSLAFLVSGRHGRHTIDASGELGDY